MTHCDYIWQKAALLASQYPDGKLLVYSNDSALSITPEKIILWNSDGENEAHVDILKKEVICMRCDPCDIEDSITGALHLTAYANLIKQAEKDGNSYSEWCSSLASKVAAAGGLALGDSLRVQPQERDHDSDAAEPPVLHIRRAAQGNDFHPTPNH
jgi:hypothetical protein